MRFYTGQHRYYCGIDLHARTLYLCILDGQGNVLLHKRLRCEPQALLHALDPYREDLVVCSECIFCWYWLADLCAREQIPFVLGHALYMKAIHGAKAKNDRLDAFKIASLLRGGNLPEAHAYPARMRATRDLMRRRLFFVRRRAELLTHLRNSSHQHNLGALPANPAYAGNRASVVQHFPEPAVAASAAADVTVAGCLDEVIAQLELEVMRRAKEHDRDALHRLRSIPGVGKVLATTMLYEIGDVARFPRVQQFSSYARLIAPSHESAGDGPRVRTSFWDVARSRSTPPRRGG